ncbi:MAG: translocation/assembly module TamB domain-containing protein [Bacteroidota bacterium]
MVISLVIIVGLPSVAYFIFRLPSVQSWLSTKISTYVSEKINTKVSLEGVDISVFDHFIFEKFYIEDQQQDTLLYFNKLAVNIDRFSIPKQFIFLDKIKLDHFVSHISDDSLGVSNFQFIIDQLSSENPDTITSKSDWKISCEKIEIINSAFSYFVADTIEVNYGINYSDLDLCNVNLYAKNLLVAGNSVMVNIDSLSVKDKSGLNIKRLQSNAFVSNERIDLNKFTVITDNSNLYIKKLKFSYASFNAFSNFLKEVEMKVLIADSTLLNLKDLSYFVPQLKGHNQRLSIFADINGTVDQLNAKKIDIRYGKGTRLKTNFKLNGLAAFDNLTYNIFLDSLTTSIVDINSIRDPSDTTKRVIPIPENLKHIGKIYYSGQIKGSLQDIEMKGDLITGLGNIISDLRILENTETSSYKIKGNFIGKELLIGNVIENKNVGKFDIIDTLDVNISKKGDIEGWSKGLVSNLQLYNYSYDSIHFNGIIKPNSYRGNIKIDDRNIKLDLAGNYISIDSVPRILFSADLKKFIPYKLHLLEDSAFRSSLQITGNIQGDDPDEITGKLDCALRYFQNSNNKLKSEKIYLTINRNEDSSKTVKLNSDFMDIDMSGKMKLKTIGKSINKFICQYMPSLADTTGLQQECDDSLSINNPNSTDVSLNLRVKNIDKLINLFLKDTKIKYGTHINGRLNFDPDKFSLEAYSPELTIEGTKLTEVILNGDNRNEQLSFYLNSKNIFWSEENSLDNSLLQSFIKNDSIYLDFMWNSFLDTLNYNGNISIVAGIENRINASPVYKIKLKPSNFTIHKNEWDVKSNEILIDTNFIDLGEIDAQSNNDEHFFVKGVLSDKLTDTLELDVNKFDIKIMNLLFEETGVRLNGKLSGNTQIVSVLGDLQVNSEDSISNLKINNEKIGKLFLDLDWDNTNSTLSVLANTQLKKTKNLILKGDYKIKDDALDFKIDITRLPFLIVEPFVNEYISDVNGKISGDMTIKGSTKKPDIRAGLKFVRAGFKANYTQTYYSFTDSLFIEEGNIRFKKMKLNAGRNSFAWVSGDISHKDFDEIKLDITFDAHNFLFLNTRQTDSSLFYGNIFASGGIKLKGEIDDLNIDIKLKTGKGTKFFLPLMTSSEASQNEFITFKTLDTTKNDESLLNQVDLSGMNINFDLEVTSDATMQIIMDETVGDIIKTQGTGNLNIKVDKAGDLFIFGLYTVYKGDYLFTLQNLVNKKFILDKGSTIRWYGDPYNAEMKMAAVYRINKVPVYDLTKNEEHRDTRTDAYCNLLMKGGLVNPIIEFDLDVPNAQEPIPSNIDNLTQDELNKQILSLLIMNKFRPLPGLESSVSSGAVLSTNGIEMLTNQLSNWLSKLSDDFDIGLNYTQGGAGTSDEVEVALSTQLFNNMVSINTNVGVGGSKTDQTSQAEQNSANKIVGDVEIEVKLNKKGSLKGKVFNRSNKRSEFANDQTLYTQGVSVLYRKNFNTFGELFRSIWESITFKKRRDEKNENENANKDIERKEPETNPVTQ